MTVVLFIRHALNEYVKTGRLAGRLPNVHLNKKGRKQAKVLAEFLSGAAVKAIYSSPLERTMETAQPLAAALKTPIIPRKGLNEVDFGDWQGKKLKKLSRLEEWGRVQNYPSRMRFPNGESFTEAQQRIVKEIEFLLTKHNERDIIACVSHSDLIKLGVAHFTGLPLDLFQRLQISPASITTMVISPSGSRLINLNYQNSFTFSAK